MVSICIPTYEMNGTGVACLKQLLDSLCNQTYKRFEVIISDDSKDDAIKNFLAEAKYALDIRYIKNDSEKRSTAININHAISHAKYPIIKPIFQNDWIINDKMIGKIIGAKGKWGAMGWKHPDKTKAISPKWTKNILIGDNRIGCPTGIYFEKRDDLLFDEKLIHLMDVDFYYRLHQVYGIPYYINDPCFVSRDVDNSTSKIEENSDLYYKEIRYLEQKFNRNDLEKKFNQRVKLMKYRNVLVDIKRFVFRS